MQIYKRYITKKLFTGFLYCISSILAIVWLTRSNDLLQLIINSGVGLSSFFTFSVLAFPEILYNAIPIGVFVSTILVFMKLRQSREIFALRNAGLSDFDLAKPVLFTATIIVGLHLLIACTFSPMAKRIMNRKIQKFNEKVGSFIIEDRAFMHPTENLTIYCEKKPKLKTLVNIFVNDKRSPDKDVTIYAKTGSFVDIDNQTYLHLFEGNRQVLTSEGYISMDFNFLAVNIDLQKKPNKLRKILPSERGFVDLLTNKEERTVNLVELYNRISLPLVSYLVAIISLIMVLKFYKTSRSSLYTTANFIINFTIVVCFIILNRLSANNFYYCIISFALLLSIALVVMKNITKQA